MRHFSSNRESRYQRERGGESQRRFDQLIEEGRAENRVLISSRREYISRCSQEIFMIAKLR
jgi:peptide subunit release factor 1 (eRF1)